MDRLLSLKMMFGGIAENAWIWWDILYSLFFSLYTNKGYPLFWETKSLGSVSTAFPRENSLIQQIKHLLDQSTLFMGAKCLVIT